MAHKSRLIEYTKRGDKRMLYAIISDDGTIKTCSPKRWHCIDLPDHTPHDRLGQCAELRLRATRWQQFNRQVEDNALLREWGHGGVVDMRPAGLISLCEHHGILV